MKKLIFQALGLTVITVVFVFAWNVSVNAIEINVRNPLEVDNVESLSERIRDYLLGLVGGIAIVFFAVSGILYAVGGTTMNDGMITASKKAFVGGVLGLAIVLGANMILQETYFIVLGKGLDFDNLSAKEILIRLSNFLLAILGIIFLIMTVVGGIFYFLGGADEGKIELGKKIFISSIIGLVISLSALILLKQIDRIITGGTG